MESKEGYSQAQSGNKDAFLEWSRPYAAKAGRFALQNGIYPTDIEAFQLAVMQQLFKNLPGISEQQAVLELYRIAVEKLPVHQQGENSQQPTEILRFEEDLETHGAIQQVSGVSRVAFTLFHFHGLSVEAISTLLGEGEDDLYLQLENAAVFLKETLGIPSVEMVDKRLALLDKSYSRFIPELDEENVLQQAAEASEQAHDQPKPQMKKGVAALLAAAGLFLACVIGVSFALNDPNQETTAATEKGDEAAEVVTDKMVQDWVAEYTEIRESSPGRLGIKQEVYEELQYVKEADQMMKMAFSDETLDQVRNDPENMQQIVDNLLRQIETPLGMEQSLYKSPLLAEDSAAFLESYALKTKELMSLANDVLHRHQDELAEAAKSGELASENLLAERDVYSEEVELLISSINEQMLTVFVHPTESRFIVRRNIEALHGHPSLMGDDGYGNTYLYALASEPYYDESGLMMPVETIAYHLNTMEMLLTEEDAESALFKEYRDYLQNSFWMVLKGTENDPVFDSNGVVHEHYKQAWKSLVHYSTDTLIYTMLPIVEEMEANNWTASAHYDQLAYPDILANLDLQRSGKLEELLPHADMEIDNELVDMQDFDYSRVVEIYTTFAASHDLSVLKNSSPIDVFLLYYYANSLEDPETMWHLLNDDELKPELAVYLAEWQQLPDIKEELQFVEVVEEGVQRIGRNIELPLQYSSHSMDMIHAQPPVMVTSDHVWLLRNQISENYASAEEKAALFQKAGELYEALATNDFDRALAEAKPGVVGAAYLLAAENKNYEAMKKLTAHSEREPLDAEFESSVNERIYPSLSEQDGYSFSSEYYQTIEGQVQGTFYVTDTDEKGQTFSQEGFSMTKTPEGWKMSDLYFY